ncbi:cytochrome c oxidase cbb3-type subunit 4 [Breoghania corrubedonensis]|uniref:Cytochrome c oxidase cbb3-type subunit 4 n=1 Tax=Breoghania corrubedonensis TaxID=665038 RepID=A0A2T5VEA9_9HYPH|nr:cbb3-type cytochrome c oxidase subunit 3 [Breoghania corrubedonensis]PTW62089.1 cytochrome c oxidase cbb3-type subunit 4 [Breoghania corrubedonensis]
MEDYAQAAHFAQTWGLLYFVLIFLGVLAYAMWPRNRKKFDEAANVPLRED